MSDVFSPNYPKNIFAVNHTGITEMTWHPNGDVITSVESPMIDMRCLRQIRSDVAT